jgi:CDP-paratose 2-epimerase
VNILVTGGGGFIGYEVATRFRNEGHDVYIMDNNPDTEKWLEAQTLGMYRIKDTIHNLNVKNEYKRFDIDVIIHTAAQTAMTKSMVSPKVDFYLNALGTLEVCEFAREHNAQLLFTSSNKVYGTNVNKIAVKELPTRWEFIGKNVSVEEIFPVDNAGHGPYGCSKLAADMYVQDYHYTYGLDTTVFRMSCIYGARQRGTEDQGWVYHIAKQVYKNEPINIYGDGKQVRDILYVDDLIDAMISALDKKASGVFNIGGGVENTISVIELIHKLRGDTINDGITYHDWRPADQKVYISNINKAINILKWKPKISVDEGLNKLKEAF